MRVSNVKCMGLALSLFVATPLVGQGYGESVAVGNGQVIVGESLNTMVPGYVYVYEKGAGGAWSEVQRLEASNSANGDHFGRSLALTGNHLLVGSTTMETIYVFEKDGSGTWRETQTLQAMGSVEGDYIGRMAAVDGDNVLMAAWAYGESRGAVYVFHRDESGRWSESGRLTGSDSLPNDLFGMSIAIDGDVVLVGAPERGGSTGAVYVFQRDESGTWSQRDMLTGAGTAANSRFGRSVALRDGHALIGASTHEQGLGTVFAYTYDEDSAEWEAGPTLKPFDGGEPGTQFGAVALYGDNEVWFGAPGASGFEGRIYSMTRAENGDWTRARKIKGMDLKGGDIFGGSFAVDGDVAVVGVIGDDFGLGTVAVLERSGDEWAEVASLFGAPSVSLEAITGDQIDCSEGTASVFDCQDVDMLSFLPVSDLGGGRGVQVNDLWGWTDPESGREYALVGRYDGTSFVDVSDPSDPRYLGNLPMTEGAQGNSWRDIKVFDDHAFIVADGAGQHGMQVFDLTKLRDVGTEPVTFEQDAIYERIASAHNIVINEDTGFAYAVGVNSGGETCGGGLHMINIQDPLTPLFAGCFQDMSTGNQSTGYSHDAQCISYHGPDEKHRGQEICFGANETALSVADVTDKAAPVALSMASYPNVGYSHQGWIDEEHEYFYMNDELDEIGGNVDRTRTLVWDIKDLDDPILVKEYFADNTASDHNLYIRGNLMYQSNYVSGLRILDISDRENPELVGFFDTVPWSADAPGFDGSWSNYPYFESGIIIVNSGAEGMFILRKRERNLIP